jgi:hypothetical protein
MRFCTQPAHGVERSVGHAHHMEGVGHAGRLVDAALEAAAVRLGQIRGDDPDAVRERFRLPVEPGAQICGTVALHDVDDNPPLEIHEARGVLRRVLAGCGKPGGLIDAQLAHLPNPVRVVDEWLAVLTHGIHDCVPGDAELAGQLRHGPGVQADLTTAGERRTAGEQAPGREGIGDLRPGTRRAFGLLAPEAPLVPHQAHGSAEGRQIPVLNGHPVVSGRYDPALRAPGELRDRLDVDHQFVVNDLRVEHAEAWQTEHHLGHAGSVRHVGGLTFVAAYEKPQR